MLKVRIAALILAALFPAAALAQPAAPASNLAGIWEGTIGTLPVRACFVAREWGTFGAYYYRSHLQLVGLQPEDGAPGTYSESAGDPGAARWRSVRAARSNLTATWTGGRRTLPVQLHRVSGGGGEDGACASLDFHQPRLDAGVRTVRTRATVDGVAYTKLVLDVGERFGIAIQTFALDGDSAAVRRINTALGAELAGSPPSWFECISASLAQSAFEGSESETLTPAMISRRWLSVASEYGNSCGGAHPNDGSNYLLFDLTTGAEVALLDWFRPTAVKREHIEGADDDSRTLEPAFRAFLLTGWHAEPDQAECAQILRDQDYWSAGLTRTGIVFSPDLPHVVQACREDFVVSFDRIRPWLTPEAVAAISALRAERPAG